MADRTPRFVILHSPSCDEGEAATLDAALLAATTFIVDNDRRGVSRIYRGVDADMIDRRMQIGHGLAVATIDYRAVEHDGNEED